MKKYIINLSLLLFSCNPFSKDPQSSQKYNFKVKAKSILNPANEENIDNEKGTNTTLYIKE
ncbi:conserved hypothetical protein (plasmid) [Borreliella burgdorferi 29805]|uniref:hypothetical protein n=1 Tax=Borreliella burgdorferi TaxID=139 RepID=UPI00017F4767|nr:hypothetical protein [Borreliella burgdorferi]ACO38551.1 conserved hypothetical protein [Borreliella burgdorferi 29805]MCD2309421.1 hypothetical protein [Borreliella burgdorferi]MCD2318602.1 hypothetical protein [Borreliella burgdorferi]MCD2376796.1 hypothetical protein [Borreliella burgdorferi]MCD2378100.1 hypothetical protein [Borreliella burgdorferi]